MLIYLNSTTAHPASFSVYDVENFGKLKKQQNQQQRRKKVANREELLFILCTGAYIEIIKLTETEVGVL